MDRPQPPSVAPSVPIRAPAEIVTAWPRSAQFATVFALGVATALLAVHIYGYARWGTRPCELERGALPPYRVDLNRADRAELLQLPGVGESLAERIEAHRRETGGFRSVEELSAIHGVGPATLERLRPWVRVGLEGSGEDIRQDQPPSTISKKPFSSGRQASGSRTTSKKEAALSTPIDLNRASVTELQRVPGIGPIRARDIVEERRKKPFQSVEDLARVKGIKGRTLEKLRPFFTVERDSIRVAAAGTQSS